MADVFARTQLNFGGAFAADTGLLSGGTLTGVMMQNLTLNYSQMISRIYEIGLAGQPPSVYYVGGRSQGNLGVGHVVGPALAMKAFYTSYSDVCSAGQNSISVNLTRAACGRALGRAAAAKTVRYNAKFCVLVQIGISTQANDLVINESSQVTFGNLEYDEN